jgi:hypothetical protein
MKKKIRSNQKQTIQAIGRLKVRLANIHILIRKQTLIVKNLLRWRIEGKSRERHPHNPHTVFKTSQAI